MTDGHGPGPVVVTLLRVTPDQPVPVASFTRRPDGVVTMALLLPSVAAGSLLNGIYSARLDRLVRMRDGEVFLEALGESLAGSAYWYVTSA